MNRYRQHLDLASWVAIFLVTMALLGVVLSLISMFFPYAPSRRALIFCHYALPILVFLVFVFPGLIRVIRIRSDPRRNKRVYEGNLLIPIIVGALMSMMLAWIMPPVPGILAKFFAKTRVNIPVTVDRLDGFQGTYDYWTWIYFKHDGHVNRFMWTRSNALMQSLKHGDCIELHGRQWPLGLYVDSISRSNACYSTSDPQAQ